MSAAAAVWPSDANRHLLFAKFSGTLSDVTIVEGGLVSINEKLGTIVDGSTLEVLFSKDWDGTVAGIASATWGVVSDAYVTEDDDFFGAWFESGIVDLSCETGQIYLAFKYVGSGDSDSDGTYELDFVSIDAQ